MLRSYLPGLGLSAAVVVASLAAYTAVIGGPSGVRSGPAPDEDARVVQLPRVPPAERENEERGEDEAEGGGAVEVAAVPESGPAAPAAIGGGPSTGSALEGVTPGTGRGDAGDPDNGGLGGGDGGSGGGDGGSGGGDGGSGGGDGGITPVSGGGDGGAAPGGPPPVVPEEVPAATPPSHERLPAPNTGVRVGVPETVEDEDPPKVDAGEDLSDPIAAADHQRAAGVDDPDDVVDLDVEAFGDGVEARIGDGDHRDAVEVDDFEHGDVEVIAGDDGKRCDGGADKHDAVSVGVEVRAGDDDAHEDVGVHVREGDDDADEDVGVEVRAGDDDADADVGVHVREGDDDADEDVAVEVDRGDHEANGDVVVEAESVCDVETGDSCPDDSAADGD